MSAFVNGKKYKIIKIDRSNEKVHKKTRQDGKILKIGSNERNKNQGKLGHDILIQFDVFKRRSLS